MGSEARRLIWRPQEGPQKALVDCPLPLVFFGGARGGGKTDGVLGKWAIKAERYQESFNGIAFRRTTVSFEDAVERARQILVPELGWSFSMGGNRPLFTHKRGARVSFRYLDRVMDADEYQGRNLTDVWIEEAGQYPQPDPIDKLFATLRSAAGVPVQMILTANPGGAGQHWLRERFGLHPFPAKPRWLKVAINEGEIDAAVIPSRIGDNRILLAAQPDYVDRLRLTGSAELVRAWLEGDWSAVEGAFFDGWSERRHVVVPFDVPPDWPRFRSMDWGYAAPFSVGWWAVASDGVPGIPRGCLVRYREWYGASAPNKGLRLDAEAVARGILERTDEGERIAYTVSDPSMFAQDGGPSLAERMAKVGLWAKPGDNRRVGKLGALGGWDQMRARLRGDADGLPMLVAFDTCRDFIRTVPVLQHDPMRPEDLDTEAEDHVADEARYACMSRPWQRAEPKKPPIAPRAGMVMLPGPPKPSSGKRIRL